MRTSEPPNEESGAARDENNAGGRERYELTDRQPVPLFLRDSKEGRKDDAQDEKDAMEE